MAVAVAAMSRARNDPARHAAGNALSGIVGHVVWYWFARANGPIQTHDLYPNYA